MKAEFSEYLTQTAPAIRTMIAAGIPVETVATAFGMTVEECKSL